MEKEMTQADLQLEPRCKLPERGSQCYELLMAFKNGERLTTMEAFKRFGITTISQRVGELKRFYGWPIKSRPLKIGPKTYVAEYWL
jgi:hypothetical protein